MTLIRKCNAMALSNGVLANRKALHIDRVKNQAIGFNGFRL